MHRWIFYQNDVSSTRILCSHCNLKKPSYIHIDRLAHEMVIATRLFSEEETGKVLNVVRSHRCPFLGCHDDLTTL